MREFPREKLTFKEKLGEGQFGEVCFILQRQCVSMDVVFLAVLPPPEVVDLPL